MTKLPGGGDKPAPELDLEAELAAAETQAAIDARFKDRLDPNHPVLTVEEQLQALKEAELAATAERKKRALADLKSKEKERLLSNGGQLTGDPVKDELVDVILDLAPEVSRYVMLNNKPYYHGQRYRVPRHVADTLRDQAWQTHRHQNELDGKGMANLFRQSASQVLSGKEVAA